MSENWFEWNLREMMALGRQSRIGTGRGEMKTLRLAGQLAIITLNYPPDGREFDLR